MATAIATAGLVVLPGQYPANSQSSPLSPLTERRVATGWIPWWDLDEGLVSVEDHPRVFSEVSLFWFSATAQSTLQNAQNNNMDETSLVDAVQRLHAVGVRALPTVTDFAVDPKAMSRLLSDKARRAALVAEIVGMVGRVDADGVDIDFERINNTSGRSRTSVRRTFPLFLGRLHQRLARKGWLLSVSLPARTSDRDPNWSVFSYRAIAPTVDRARIQTYNFHYSQGSPGPLAPLAWVNTVARYAKARFGRVPASSGSRRRGSTGTSSDCRAPVLPART